MKPTLTVLVLLILGISAPGTVTVQGQSGEWVDVQGAAGAKLRGIVFRPGSSPPYPVVLILHGSDGLGDAHVNLARDFAAAGFLAVAACWFGGGFGPGVGGAVACPAAPAARDAQGTANGLALAEGARRLSGAMNGRVGVVGHSAGANIALLMASSGARIDAVVSIAGAYGIHATAHDPTPLTKVDDLTAPVLLFHGEKDNLVPVESARAYEARARQLGKVVQSHYYPQGGHLLDRDENKADVVGRSIAFLQRHLRR